uniref:CDK5 regulatory subunit associated protein 3 n=1 Tax=Angiostrongylus cantonensis TaxID=6313 RepID=A0A0K0CU48_ANGCA
MINVQDLPIDIHSNKLLDWLISRRHCQKDWQKNVLVVREKIKNAILDMPESDEIVELLQGAYINYFHCLRIVEILQDTEKGTKNFLGYYSSQRMKDWQVLIILVVATFRSRLRMISTYFLPPCFAMLVLFQEIQSLYKKNNLYLAESAQILQRVVQYEIPALKRQITKAEQALEESVRKEDDYSKQVEDGKKMYEKELTRLGIQGHCLRAELLALAADLPTFIAKLADEIVRLREPHEYYVAFRHYVHQRNNSQVKLLPLINLIIRKGVQATTFEYKYGVAPDSVETQSYDLLLKQDKVVRTPAVLLHMQFVHLSLGLVVGAVARGEDALGVLENLSTQKVIRNELEEFQLMAFLVMRKDDEERETSSDMFIQGFEKRPFEISKVRSLPYSVLPLFKDLEYISSSKLDQWISQVKTIHIQLMDPQKNYLFHIRSSPQYVEKLVEKIESKRELEGRYKMMVFSLLVQELILRMQSLMVDKQNEARKQIANASQNLHVVLNSTRILQKQVHSCSKLEKDISTKYDGRKVNIVGGITAALANR